MTRPPNPLDAHIRHILAAEYGLCVPRPMQAGGACAVCGGELEAELDAYGHCRGYRTHPVGVCLRRLAATVAELEARVGALKGRVAELEGRTDEHLDYGGW